MFHNETFFTMEKMNYINVNVKSGYRVRSIELYRAPDQIGVVYKYVSPCVVNINI